MIEDLDALEEIAEFLDNHTEFGKRYEFGEMLDQFRKSLLRELDYLQEANNLITLREQLKASRASLFRNRSPTTAPRAC